MLFRPLRELDRNIFAGKKIISAIKGFCPTATSLLLNEYLKKKEFNLELKDYFAVLGPCHAEEVAAENYPTSRLPALMRQPPTPSLPVSKRLPEYRGEQRHLRRSVRRCIEEHLRGGLGYCARTDYGDNFLSVFIANCADEMAGFLKKPVSRT